MSALLGILVFLLILVLLVWVAIWLINQLDGMAPVATILKAIVVFLGLAVVLYKLAPMAGLSLHL